MRSKSGGAMVSTRMTAPDGGDEDDEALGDVDADQILLARLVVAMALVARARPVRIEAG